MRSKLRRQRRKREEWRFERMGKRIDRGGGNGGRAGSGGRFKA